MANMAQHLLDTGIKEGGRPALRMGDAVVTYDEFAHSAGRVAAALAARGVTPGDRVGLVLPNVPSFPVIYYRALTAGAAVVPMNPLLKAPEIDHYLRDAGARLVVAVDTSARPAAEAAEAVGIRPSRWTPSCRSR
jgi:long-chain acyl-CoA synthetase